MSGWMIDSSPTGPTCPVVHVSNCTFNHVDKCRLSINTLPCIDGTWYDSPLIPWPLPIFPFSVFSAPRRMPRKSRATGRAIAAFQHGRSGPGGSAHLDGCVCVWYGCRPAFGYLSVLCPQVREGSHLASAITGFHEPQRYGIFPKCFMMEGLMCFVCLVHEASSHTREKQISMLEPTQVPRGLRE